MFVIIKKEVKVKNLKFTGLSLALALILGFSGCATKVSPEGSKTRQIDASWKNSCTYIGSSETSSAMKFGARGNYETVRNNIRNITAKNGGNAYMTNDFLNDGMGHFSASFEMYKCPIAKEEYTVPKKYEALEKLKALQDKGIITQEEYDIEKTKLLNHN
jgi:hypothetical protein